VKKSLFFFAFLLLLGCADSPKQELTKEEVAARAEAARRADSLINWSRQLEEDRNLSQAFSGIHTHIMGSGNLAFDAHQDPELNRRMVRASAAIAEQYRKTAPKVEEARRQMIQAFQEAQREEERRVY
jgi:hypothetical protein